MNNASLQTDASPSEDQMDAESIKSTTDAATSPQPDGRVRQLYTTIWRWHFYAGLLAIPICSFLGVTGGIYLFKPFVEPWLYADLQQVTPTGTPLPIEVQLAAVVKAFPEDSPTGATLGATPEHATEFSLRTKARETRLAYIDPYSGRVTGSLLKEQMFMRVVRNLHGELLMGWFGSAFVELTACWTIILLITGLYLWWPRPGWQWKGIFLPRIRSGTRVFWRDMHVVIGFYSAAIVLVLLFTGLPWTNVWGGAFKRVQSAVGQRTPEAAGFRTSFQSQTPDDSNAEPMSLSQAVALAERHSMPAGYEIKLPRGPTGVFGFTHRALKLEESKYIYVDQYTGETLGQASWDDFPVTAKAVSYGIRLHQGELFGFLGFTLMLLGALAAIWMCVTAFIMWWKRRPQGKLGAPPFPGNWQIPRGIAIITIAFGILFPLVGVSLILIWLLDRFLFPRIPVAAKFLGV